MESLHTPESTKEKIVLSAMRYQGKIYTGLNHKIVFDELKMEHQEAERGERGGVEEGFTTTTQQFVDRIEAKKIAIEAGQTKENGRPELYSDDLEYLQK
jgi:hypothetical protein